MRLFLLINLWICYTECSRILGVFPMIARSHYILGSALMRGLAEKGHDVTVISPFGEKNPPKNGSYRDIILTGFLELNEERKTNFLDLQGMNPAVFHIFMNSVGNELVELTFKHPNVQELINSGEKFDAVIVEQFVNDAHKVFAYHFKAPLIAFVTFGSNSWINSLVANPAPPSYVPEIMIDFEPTCFFSRVKNFLTFIFAELNRQLLFFPAQNEIMKKYFPDAPDLDVLNYNISLVLLNSHFSTNKAVPRVPNMIDIGGFHLHPSKKLPSDLQKFLDDAKEGVIYFSMGSNLRSTMLPVVKREALLKTFAKLKQKVLWKWEEDVLPGQPQNVKLSKWLPQQDILAHPNIKLFITHGGLLSTIESVYHGVPILAIPIFGDQKINADEAVSNGFGLSIPYSEVTEEKLTESINEILSSPGYRENMKRRSKVMLDRRTQPIDDAEYWIEYVIRHQGAPHLRVAGVDLPWYQYLSIDVALFLFVVVLVISYVTFWVIKRTIRICLKSPKEKLKKN